MYRKRVPSGEPPCSNCRIEPREENEDALRVFFAIHWQFIMGPRGPVDINHLAIHATMDLYGIKKRRECFEKVLILARWWMDRIEEQRENDG